MGKKTKAKTTTARPASNDFRVATVSATDGESKVEIVINVERKYGAGSRLDSSFEHLVEEAMKAIRSMPCSSIKLHMIKVK